MTIELDGHGRRRKRILLGDVLIWMAVVVVTAAVIGCGGDGGDSSEGSSVVESLSVDQTVIPIGDGTVVSVKFSFAADDVFRDGRHILVAVQLPPIVRYRNGTSDIKRLIDDRQVTPAVTTCSDGRSILLYDLDDGELTDAENPSGDPDAELRLTIDAFTPGAPSTISGAASNDAIVAACDSFPSQGSAIVTVP